MAAIGKNILGRMLYMYFNWRQDTSRDLLVTFLVFACMLLAGGGVRRYVVDDTADLAVGNLWADVYQVRLAQPCVVLMLPCEASTSTVLHGMCGRGC